MKNRISPEIAGVLTGGLLGATLIIKAGIPVRMAGRVELSAMVLGMALAPKFITMRCKDMRILKIIAPAAIILVATTTAAYAGTVLHIPSLPDPRKPCGDYVDDCSPRYSIMRGLGGQSARITAALGRHNLDEGSADLDRLFTGGAEKSPDSGVVLAGYTPAGPDEGVSGIPSPKKTARNPTRSIRAEYAVPSPSPFGTDKYTRTKQGRFVLVGEASTARDLLINLGATVVAKGAEKAADAIEKYVDRDQTKESIEKYGGCRLQGTCEK